MQSQLDALQHEISQTNQINSLSNVTITSPTFSGVSTSNIPEGGNLYYTDARVESVLAASTTIGTTFGANTWTALNLFSGGASTTNFSNFGSAYFGGTATSSFNSTGALTLVSNGLTVGTNQFVVSSGNVGIGTTSPGSVLSVNGTGYFTGNLTSGPLLTVGSNLYPIYQNGFGTTVATTLGSATITVLGTPSSPIQVGMALYGNTVTFPQPIWITAVNGNTLTMSAPAGATNSSIVLQFGYNRWDTHSSAQVNTLGAETGYFGAAATGNSTWPNEYLSGSNQPNYATLYAVSPTGGIGIYSASRSSDSGGIFTTPEELLAINDATTTKVVWGQYIQSMNESTSSSITFNAEWSMYNAGNVETTDPFTTNVVGMTENARLDCGVGATVPGAGLPNNCTDALHILNNGKKYESGIVFANNTIDSSTNTNPPAIALPAGVNGNAIDWYTAAGNIGWSLFSNDTSTGSLKQIELENNSLAILNSKVGIGTTSPSANFAVQGNGFFGGPNANLILEDTTNSRVLTIGETDGFNGYISQSSGSLNLQLGGTTRFTLGSTAYFANNVGIGTTTPYSRLTVWGPDTSASTGSFLVVNSASTTEFVVHDDGSATLAGSLTQNSDQRLKTNIQSLDASSSLAAIEALNPVTFNWVDSAKGVTPQLGFIAQQVLPIFPNLISTTSATDLTPDGTLSLNYIGFIAPVVKSIQQIAQEIANLADSFTTKELTFTRATGDEVDANTVKTKQLCVEDVCVTKSQLQAMLASAGSSGGSSVSGNSSNQNASSATLDTPPAITINGSNPAHVNVGDTYADLGATIKGPQADLNLGIKTFLNGTLTSNIAVDTSHAATDTIDYVVTDSTGLSATSTRTVIVSAPPAPNTPSTSASSTVATSTPTAIIISAPVESNTLSTGASSTTATSSPSTQ